MSDLIDAMEETLVVGCAVILQSNEEREDHHRIRAVVRGWQRGLYVLLDIPNAKAASFPFRSGAECVMRYLADGDACACKTVLQDLGSGSHFSYVRVRWPDDIQRVRVRKHERVPVRVPCKIKNEEGIECEGELHDISAFGCKISSAQEFAKGAVVSLTFKLPDGSLIEGLQVSVVSIILQNDSKALGCQFFDPDELIVNDIEFFVAATVARLRGSQSMRPSVLIIDRDIAHATDLKVALKDQDYEVTLAVGVVDGFFALRLAPPTLLLADMEQIGLSAIEVCKAIRATRQFKNLPTIVYGGSPGDEKRVLDAGATQWFSTSDKVKDILVAVEKISAKLHAQSAEKS